MKNRMKIAVKFSSGFLLATGVTLIILAAVYFLHGFNEYASARGEYAQLSGMGAAMSGAAGETPSSAVGETPFFATGAPGFAAINPDYAGWISIDGVGVDYPVVRGADNDFYINRTFRGAKNPAGSIYMDYRCAANFDSPVCIVYGHNMKDGSMFASLKKYLDQDFIDAHPLIVVETAEGELLTYRIFSARHVDAWDGIYSQDPAKDPDPSLLSGAPDGADRFLVLSTCVGGGEEDARLIVCAYLY